MHARAQEAAYCCTADPGLENRQLARAHGVDLGMEPWGPLILSVPSTPQRPLPSKLPRPRGRRDAGSSATSWCLEGGCPW